MGGNLVYDASHSGFHLHYGRNNVVRDNIFAFGHEANFMISRGEQEHLTIVFGGIIVLSAGAPSS